MKDIKQLMNSFAKNSSPTVTKKLIALNKICQQQYDRGSRDFSVATIGKIAEEEGLMKAQTIRNTSGEKYYTLIKAWSDNNPSNKVTKKNELDWIDSIDDLQTKWLVRDMHTELVKLRSEVSVLKSVETNIYITETSNAVNSKELENNQTNSLSQVEYEALADSIDSKRLKNIHLFKGELGEIKNPKGINVMPFGFVSAIEKIISISDESA